MEHCDIANETSQKVLNILAFGREVNSSGGKHFTHPSILEIRNNGHSTSISCEVVATGKYDLHIPFAWWHQEHPIANIDKGQKWTLTNQCWVGHVEHEGGG